MKSKREKEGFLDIIVRGIIGIIVAFFGGVIARGIARVFKSMKWWKKVTSWFERSINKVEDLRDDLSDRVSNLMKKGEES